MNKVKYTELSQLALVLQFTQCLGSSRHTWFFTTHLGRVNSTVCPSCDRRVRVSCVNIYLECTRTMSADCLIKCGTWRNLLCTLHCTWDALKVLNEPPLEQLTFLQRERETELTSFAVDHPLANNELWLICWALSCNSRQGHLSLNDVMRLAAHSGNSHGSHNAYAALPLPLVFVRLLLRSRLVYCEFYDNQCSI